MEADFWHDKWETHDIGFHEGEVNAFLSKNLNALALPKGARIFVPLCGKTRDIAWLISKGYQVVGVELSPIAVSELFEEMQLEPNVQSHDDLQCFSANNLTIWLGDFFGLTSNDIGPIDAVYDRAALVALTPELRDKYAAHLMAVTASAPQLLITFEYDQSKMSGPPFSIDANEVNRHYAAQYQTDLLSRDEIVGGFRNVATDVATWLLTPKK